MHVTVFVIVFMLSKFRHHPRLSPSPCHPGVDGMKSHTNTHDMTLNSRCLKRTRTRKRRGRIGRRRKEREGEGKRRKNRKGKKRVWEKKWERRKDRLESRGRRRQEKGKKDTEKGGGREEDKNREEKRENREEGEGKKKMHHRETNIFWE